MGKYNKLRTRVEQLELAIMGYREIYILPRDKNHLILRRADGTMVPAGENKGDFVTLGEALEAMGVFKEGGMRLTTKYHKELWGRIGKIEENMGELRKLVKKIGQVGQHE
ncbi:hypothetical protein LCGC14_1757510 [marine sediment metagenome]|uniref:Uncharacterized protein n=1 Tax=marine sediment metagenome TaxID=412755 RepID=A0A0F9K1L7_9ZZZZ